MHVSSVGQPRRHGLAAAIELKARREVADPARASHRDPTVLQRLTQRLEHVLLELGQLVEEEHPTVGERHLAGMGGLPPPTSPETDTV